MASKTIKISEENYKWLLHMAAELQRKNQERASFDDALNNLKNKKKKLSDFAGAWNISDYELTKIKDELKRGWKKWKMPFA